MLHSKPDTQKARLRSLSVLKDFADKKSCPVGLQYRPRPLVRPNEQFSTAFNKICQKVQIRQQEKNSSADTETISSLKKQLDQKMFPDQTRRENAERRIQSTTSRYLSRTNLSQKKTAASKKQPKEKKKKRNELSTIKAKLNELTALMNILRTKIKQELQLKIRNKSHISKTSATDFVQFIENTQLPRQRNNCYTRCLFTIYQHPTGRGNEGHLPIL